MGKIMLKYFNKFISLEKGQDEENNIKMDLKELRHILGTH